jgi:hypothetical protein
MTYHIIFAFILSYSLLFFIGIENVFANSEAAFMKVIMLVNNTGGGTAQPSDFTIRVDGAAEPWNFVGSHKGTLVLVGPGTHEVSMLYGIIVNEVPYAIEFSGNCVTKSLTTGEIAIKPGDRKTCIITATYPNFD